MSTTPLDDRTHSVEDRYCRQAGAGRDRSYAQLHAELAAGLDCDDRALVELLIGLGITPETAPAFEALPLVEVAWADGEIAPDERWHVLMAAVASGLELGRPAHAQLELWLRRRPSPELLEAWQLFADRTLTGRRAAVRARRVIEAAHQVAAADGGLLGVGAISRNERAIVARIRDALGVNGDVHVG